MAKTLRLTDEQAKWLLIHLTSGTDGFFENNQRSRRINDNIATKLKKVM